jgi:hypothetical protein
MLAQIANFTSKFLATLVKSLSGAGHVYHPEKYYMRGPGPQWHAKHD